MQVTDAMVKAGMPFIDTEDPYCTPSEDDFRKALTAALAEMWRPVSDPTGLPQDGMYIAANDHQQVAMIEARNGYRIAHNMPGYADWAPVCNITAWQPLPAPPMEK